MANAAVVRRRIARDDDREIVVVDLADMLRAYPHRPILRPTYLYAIAPSVIPRTKVPVAAPSASPAYELDGLLDLLGRRSSP
jgi:hypothetical protein